MVLGFEFRVSGLDFLVWGIIFGFGVGFLFWFLVSGFWFLVSGFWFLVSGLKFLVSGFGAAYQATKSVPSELL